MFVGGFYYYFSTCYFGCSFCLVFQTPSDCILFSKHFTLCYVFVWIGIIYVHYGLFVFILLLFCFAVPYDILADFGYQVFDRSI